MANLGTVTELVNNEKLELGVRNAADNADNNWILMQDCRLTVDRPISRETTSGGGVVYFFGAGQNELEFTLLLSTPELGAQGTLGAEGNLLFYQTRTTAGDLPTRKWYIRASNVAGGNGSIKTLTFNAKLPRFEIQRLAGVGGVIINGRLQLIDDTITVATSNPP